MFHDVLHNLDFIFKTVLESALEAIGRKCLLYFFNENVNIVPLWKSEWRRLHHYSHASDVLFSDTLSGYISRMHKSI